MSEVREDRAAPDRKGTSFHGRAVMTGKWWFGYCALIGIILALAVDEQPKAAILTTAVIAATWCLVQAVKA